MIDDVLIYNRALSESEIQELYVPTRAPGYYIQWWGDRSGLVPTDETSKTEQATAEAFESIVSFPFYNCYDDGSCSNSCPIAGVCGVGPFCFSTNSNGQWHGDSNCGGYYTGGYWDIVYLPPPSTFALKYGSISPDSKYNSSCDYNGDGDVDGNDLAKFSAEFWE